MSDPQGRPLPRGSIFNLASSDKTQPAPSESQARDGDHEGTCSVASQRASHLLHAGCWGARPLVHLRSESAAEKFWEAVMP